MLGYLCPTGEKTQKVNKLNLIPGLRPMSIVAALPAWQDQIRVSDARVTPLQLQVLSIKMDPAEIRLIQYSIRIY